MTPPRPRTQAIPATVVATQQLTPVMRRVTVHAPGLIQQGRAWLPGQWVRAYVPDAAHEDRTPGSLPVGHLSATSASAGVEGRVARAYTILNWNPVHETCDLDFVLHGHGPAASWAAAAAPGDQLPVAGPMGRYQVDAAASHYAFAADATALPALTALGPLVGAATQVQVLAEVAGSAEHAYLEASLETWPAAASVTWLHTAPGAPSGIASAVTSGRWFPPEWVGQPGLKLWAAGEASQTMALRSHCVATLGIARTALHAAGYWRSGVTGDDPSLG